MNKQKSRQHKNHDAKYTAQFHKTTANKLRRAKKRAKVAASPKAKARAEARHARNIAKDIPRLSTLRKGAL